MEFESEVILHLTIVTRWYNQTTTQRQLHLALRCGFGIPSKISSKIYRTKGTWPNCLTPPPEFSFRQNETSLKKSEILSIENFQLSRRKNCSHELIAKVGAIIINWCDLKKGRFMQNK